MRRAGEGGFFLARGAFGELPRWHPCRGAGLLGMRIRWCRFAQPPATCWDASGIREMELGTMFTMRPTTGCLLGCLWLQPGLPPASRWAAFGIAVGSLRARGGLPLGSRRNAFGIMRGGLRDCRRVRSPGALWRGILTARGTRLTGDLEAARENAARRALLVARAPWLGVDARF